MRMRTGNPNTQFCYLVYIFFFDLFTKVFYELNFITVFQKKW